MRVPLLVLCPAMAATVVACGLGRALPSAATTPEEISRQATAEDTIAAPVESSPAASTQHLKLIFIHHSSGENWLADENGGLGIALRNAGYFVSDTNYDWGPVDPELGGPIGSYTDIGNWWNWFLGPRRDAYVQAVFTESAQHASYSRMDADPGGENQVVLFKSCFPNSGLAGSPNDPPKEGDNPLQGQAAGSEDQTVGNAKAIYRDLLTFFAEHPDKLFVAITAPPLQEAETNPEQAANTRAFNRWLVEDWLRDYPLKNVAVFDFYNVLTTNGGDPDHNDAGSAAGNHHRLGGGAVEYVTDQGRDVSAYAYPGDSHPTAAGNQKATAEFVPLLNHFVANWLAAQP